MTENGLLVIESNLAMELVQLQYVVVAVQRPVGAKSLRPNSEGYGCSLSLRLS